MIRVFLIYGPCGEGSRVRPLSCRDPESVRIQGHLGSKNPPPIWKWFQHLVDHLPLLTCQTGHYERLQSHRPTTFPLSLIVASLMADEGDAPDSLKFDRLTLSLDGRRYDLTRGRAHSFACLPQVPGSRGFLRVGAVQDEVIDMDGEPIGAVSPYEEIGRELCQLIDQCEEVPTQERPDAQGEIDDFIAKLAGKRRKGGEGEGLTKPILKAFFSEASRASSIGWDAVFTEPDVTAQEVLASWDISSREEQTQAALRLAFPILSSRELIGLRRYREERDQRRGLGPGPTARRFAVWLLAHRFKRPPQSVANRVGAGSDWDYFEGSRSPISSE